MNVVTLSALIEIKREQLMPVLTQLVEELRWSLQPNDEDILELDVPTPMLFRATTELSPDLLREYGIDQLSINAIRTNSTAAGYLNKLEDAVPSTRKWLTKLGQPDNWLKNKLINDNPQLILIDNRDFVELHLSCKRAVNYYHMLSNIFSNKIFMTLVYLVLKQRLEEKLLTRFSHFDTSVRESDES
ncbi:MAG: hypothetical protein AAFO94_14290, partial [Bacteroidota bacterium]